MKSEKVVNQWRNAEKTKATKSKMKGRGVNMYLEQLRRTTEEKQSN